MPVPPSSTISFGIFLFVTMFAITVHLTTLDFKPVDAQKSEIVINNTNVDGNNKLVVMSNINLQNISKTGMIKVVGVINGKGFIKNIPLDELDKTTKKLKLILS